MLYGLFLVTYLAFMAVILFSVFKPVNKIGIYSRDQALDLFIASFVMLIIVSSFTMVQLASTAVFGLLGIFLGIGLIWLFSLNKWQFLTPKKSWWTFIGIFLLTFNYMTGEISRVEHARIEDLRINNPTEYQAEMAKKEREERAKVQQAKLEQKRQKKLEEKQQQESLKQEIENSWTVNRSFSEMDDTKTIQVGKRASNSIKTWLGSVTPVLVIRCKENNTDVIFQAKTSFTPVFGEYNKARIKFRIDNKKAASQLWLESTNNQAVFATRAISLIRNIKGAQTLKIEFNPFNSNLATATFDLRGLDKYLTEVAKTCHWKL